MRKFKKKASLAVVVLAGLVPCASQAQMPDLSDVHVTVGAKAWVTSWSTWFPEFVITQFVPVGNDRVRVDAVSQNIYNRDSIKNKTAFIPQISVRSGNFLVSGSAFKQETYTFGLNDPIVIDAPSATFGGLQEVQLKRKEYDLNLGYFIAPNFALAIGYKDWRNEGSSGYQFNGKGPTIGATVSTPVAAGLNFYGTFAYGFPKVDTNATLTFRSNRGDIANGGRGKYMLGEVGFAYGLHELSDALKGFVVSAGYRYQKLASARVGLPTYYVDSTGAFTTLIGQREVELIDKTEGATLGVSYTF